MGGRMQQILSTTWRICRLKVGPQDMPYSVTLLITLLISNATISILALSINQMNTEIIRQSLVLLLVPLIFSYAILYLYKRSERFIQTVCAQNAVNILLSLLMIPFLVFHPSPPQAGQTISNAVILISLFYIIVFLGFNVWLVVITAHIYRHALNVNYMTGLLAAFALMGVNILVFSFLS